MFEKLLLMEKKYEEISVRLSDPDVIGDNKLYTQLMRDYKYMTPIIDKFREYKKLKTASMKPKNSSMAAVLTTISRKWLRKNSFLLKTKSNKL